MNSPQKYIIQDIRDFVPIWLRPWILISFLLVFQVSGGVYLASANEMSSGLALLNEDIMMAGYASLIGMLLVFVIMLRLKFRFSIKTSLLTCSLGVAICNIICVNTTNVPLLVLVSFILGMFRMWGTFACNTTVQLWVTPKRDMAEWFCYIYLVVQACIQISGLATTYTVFYTQWQYMHYLIIGASLLVFLLTKILFKHYRSMPKLPLFGIDWLGAILWCSAVMCAVFVLIYGDYYDWFYSDYIIAATVACVVIVLLNVWRASFIRHPFINNCTWTYKNVYLTFFLYLGLDFLLSPSHLYEHIYTAAILHYDSLHIIALNWVVLLGIIIGAIFCYITFAKLRWKYKTMTIIGLGFIVSYLVLMYFTIDYNQTQESLFLPVLLRAFGYEIIAIVFLTALTVVPFPHFFQTIAIQGMVSACCGALLGEAILHHFLDIVQKSNFSHFSSFIDGVGMQIYNFSELYGTLQLHSLIVSMKEIYGFLSIVGILSFIACLVYRSDLRPNTIFPKFKTIRKYFKKEYNRSE